eukprot:scaffold120233_cov18-Tisochrysis_lutea.AAC.2
MGGQHQQCTIRGAKVRARLDGRLRGDMQLLGLTTCGADHNLTCRLPSPVLCPCITMGAAAATSKPLSREHDLTYRLHSPVL